MWSLHRDRLAVPCSKFGDLPRFRFLSSRVFALQYLRLHGPHRDSKVSALYQEVRIGRGQRQMEPSSDASKEALATEGGIHECRAYSMNHL